MKQKYLRNGGTIALIAVLSMTPPLSTDLYMPGLPALTVDLGTSQATASLSMTVFFICMALGMLLFGPLSDKYGRKPVLLTSVAAATALSLACAFVQSIEALLLLRALQGLGGGGMVAVSTALVKDCFDGKRMATVLAITGAISLLAPIIAPIMGVAILQVSSWRGTFVALSALMGISLMGAILLQETLPPEKRQQGSIAKPFLELVTFVRKPAFVGTLASCAIMGGPYMGYLGIASYVYIDIFGLTEVGFGFFFTVASIVATFGALLYMKINRVPLAKTLLLAGGIIAICGIGFLALGKLSPIAFLLCFLPVAFASTFTRPMVTNYLLESVERNAGAASSLINFFSSGIGCLVMVAVSFGQVDFISSLGAATVACGAIGCLILFLLVRIGAHRYNSQ